MLTGSRIWTLAVVLGLCVLATAGCRRKSSKGTTNINGSDIFTTDTFPGDEVQAGNVADDGRAMSISGTDFSGGLEYFANGSTGNGIVMYHTSDGSLYAHYYSGSTWTPPVALRALDSDNQNADYTYVVAFINPNDDGDDNDSDRAGDALIFWTSQDYDSDLGGVDTNNEVLRCTYFDVTNAEAPGFNYGFQEYASRVSDLDNDSGENISTIGLVSDGLCGEARWDDNGHSYSWGDPTTAIIVFWRQDVWDGNSYDTRSYAVRYNPDEPIDADLPLTGSGDTEVDIVGVTGASNSGTDSGETFVGDLFCSYNDFLFFRVANANYEGPSFTWEVNQYDDDDCDEIAQYVKYNLEAGTFNAAVSLNSFAVDALDGVENDARFLHPNWDEYALNSIYGSDEGVAVMFHVYASAEEVDFFGFFDDVETAGLKVSEIDQVDGSLDGQAFADLDDTTTIDEVRGYLADTRISRNGDYIWLAWYEETDRGTTEDREGWCACYHTTRYDSDGGYTPLGLAAALNAPFIFNVDVDGEDQIGVLFQDGLGYVCGAQSDPDVMNLFYLKYDSVSDDDAYLVVLTVDPSTETSGVATSFYETWDDTSVQDWDRWHHESRRDFNATDAGTDGDLVVAYREDIIWPLGDDDRLFAERLGGAAGFDEIDMDSSEFQVRGNQPIEMIGTPAGTDIGEFNDADLEDDDARWHGFTNVHIVFREYESGEYGSNGDALRTRQYQTTEDLAFADAFIPSIAGGTWQVPFDLDLPFVDPSDDAYPIAWVRNGDTVGLYFAEMEHLYYQEFGGNSGGDNDNDIGWLNIEGQSDPFLIDDDNDEELNDWEDVFVNSCTCNTLDGSMVFWTKSYGSSGGQTRRLQVRVRNAGNN